MLQGIGVKAACGAGVVGDQSFDSSYSDFHPAVGVGKSHGGQAMMHAPVIQELAGNGSSKFGATARCTFIRDTKCCEDVA